AAHGDHRLAGEVRGLFEALEARWQSWGVPPVLPRRIGHGDPKVSNFLFDGDDVCGVIDLDTMGWTSLDLELGDACRSWCSTTDESAPTPGFDLDVFEAAMDGYLAVTERWLTREEAASFPAAVERICLELAARFAADALVE